VRWKQEREGLEMSDPIVVDVDGSSTALSAVEWAAADADESAYKGR
jgi:nucleotide-binding universal stress UspA family protein